MASNGQKLKTVYPVEKESKVKESNNKLRSEVRGLRKQIRELKKENKQLKRGFSKNSQYIEDKLNDKSLEETMELVNNFDYKETEKGRKNVEKQNNSDKKDVLFLKKCPRCGTIKGGGSGYLVMDFKDFYVITCSNCDYRKRINQSEGTEGS